MHVAAGEGLARRHLPELYNRKRWRSPPQDEVQVCTPPLPCPAGGPHRGEAGARPGRPGQHPRVRQCGADGRIIPRLRLSHSYLRRASQSLRRLCSPIKRPHAPGYRRNGEWRRRRSDRLSLRRREHSPAHLDDVVRGEHGVDGHKRRPPVGQPVRQDRSVQGARLGVARESAPAHLPSYLISHLQ